jgi:superfamily II DNA or RNA helicase
MSLLKLRDYQEECKSAIWEAVARGVQRFAVVLPTGAGKTVVFAHLINEAIAKGFRVLVLVNRDELVNQTVRQVHSAGPELTIGVVKAARNEIGRNVTVASVQTLGRVNRLEQFEIDAFDFIIVDECHHIAADSYQRIIRYFGGYAARLEGTSGDTIIEVPQCYVVGFTATLVRADKRGLGDTFEEVVYKKDLVWMIRRGYLVSPFGKRINLNIDTDGVKQTGGDLGAGALGKEMIDAHAGSAIGHFLREHSADRSFLVFMPDVASAENTVSTLRLMGFTTDLVTGETPYEERTLIFKRVRSGETQGVVNCMVLTEGFDEPQFSCVVIGRMTKNPGLFIQMVGRGLRLWKLHDLKSPFAWIRKPKTDCVVGLMGNSGSVSLAGMADLTETPIKEVKDGETITDAIDREAKDKPESKDIDVSQISYEDVDLLDASAFSFRRTTGKGYLYIPTRDWLITIYPEYDDGLSFMVGLVFCGKGPRRKGKQIASGLTLDGAMAQAEQLAEEIEPTGTVSKKGASWKRRKEAPSDAQVTFAKRIGIRFPEGTTKVELSDMISDVVCSRALDGFSPKKRPMDEAA